MELLVEEKLIYLYQFPMIYIRVMQPKQGSGYFYWTFRWPGNEFEERPDGILYKSSKSAMNAAEKWVIDGLIKAMSRGL